MGYEASAEDSKRKETQNHEVEPSRDKAMNHPERQNAEDHTTPRQASQPNTSTKPASAPGENSASQAGPPTQDVPENEQYITSSPQSYSEDEDDQPPPSPPLTNRYFPRALHPPAKFPPRGFDQYRVNARVQPDGHVLHRQFTPGKSPSHVIERYRYDVKYQSVFSQAEPSSSAGSGASALGEREGETQSPHSTAKPTSHGGASGHANQ